MSPFAGAPPPGTPGWGGVISMAGTEVGDGFPANINAPMTTWSPLPCASQIGYSGACLPSRNADLVERTAGGSLTMMTARSLPERCVPHLRC